MPWTASVGAGFSTGEPWLPLGEDYLTRNVETLSSDPGSILNLYRTLLALRRLRPSLAIGDISNVAAFAGVLSYERRQGDERTLVRLNLSDASRPFQTSGEVLLSTAAGGHADGTLAPGEGVILGPGG